MEKVITISGKNYQMKASALTQFLYKNDTGRSFISDLQKLSSAYTETGNDIEASIEAMDDITTILLKISYTMIKQANKEQVGTYDEFLDGIDNLYDDSNWIQEVIEFACSPISRQLQKN